MSTAISDMEDELPKDDMPKNLAVFPDTFKNGDLPIMIYAVEEVEPKELESVFAELFKRIIVKD